MTDKLYGFKENKSRIEVLAKSEAVKDIQVQATPAGVNIAAIRGDNTVAGGGSADCE